MASLCSTTTMISANRRSEAYCYASKKTLEAKLFFCCFWREGGAAQLYERGDNILHFLAISGNDEIIKELLGKRLLTGAQLMKQNDRGDTALHEAVRYGQRKIVEMMVNEAPGPGGLVLVRNELGETPLYVAAASGEIEIFKILERHCQEIISQRTNDGSTVLHAAVIREHYRMAIHIADSCEELAQKHDDQGNTALNLLATMPSSFRSGSSYVIRNLGRTPFVPLQIIEAITYRYIPPMYVETKPTGDEENQLNEKVAGISKLERSSLTQLILGFVWFQEVDDAKQKHILTMALAKKLILQEKDWSRNVCCEDDDDDSSEVSWSEFSSKKKKNKVPNPLIQAITHGITELVEEILKKYPDAVNSLDEKGRNILHLAVKHKQADLYDFFRRKVFDKDHRWRADVDDEKNTILHLATYKDSIPNDPLGVMQKMAWEVLWFHRIMNDSCPHLRSVKNSEGMTAKELFEMEHERLRSDAEKAGKDMNQGLMVVATLIGTVSFAALFTIPGGFDQNKGSPILFDESNNKKQEMRLYLGYVGATLFASLLALGTLLSIQLSRFNMDDFRVSLPLKFILAIIGMFYSTTFTLTACLQAYILEDSMSKKCIFALVAASVLICLVFIDVTFLPCNYMYNVFRYSLTYKSPKI